MVEFNPDGSLKVPHRQSKSEPTPDHVYVLRLISRLRFPVGRKLLAETLRGQRSAKIRQLSLDHELEFGVLDLYDSSDIQDLFDRMIFDNLIEIVRLPANKYMPIMQLTSKGKEELHNPTRTTVDANHAFMDNISHVDDQDRARFEAFGDFLKRFNDEQKKAIIDPTKNILCIAGAGSGKTTVLTKRIEYLVRFRSVNPKKILAITFTRKARQEMKHRLQKLIPQNQVKIETFNSFCEKILQRNADIAYEKQYKVMNFRTRIKLVSRALTDMGYQLEDAIETYFSSGKVARTDQRSLFLTLVNDIFSLMDHYANAEKSLTTFKDIINRTPSFSDRTVGNFIYEIISHIEDYKKEYGLRDYTDQLVHAIHLFREHPEVIPQFDHILVDEYQDVNHLQVKLINLLNARNIFVVGDPRQSIYGWRGSRIEYILKFHEQFTPCAIIQLTKNYRSAPSIVKVGNQVIRSMNLPDLESAIPQDNSVILIKHEDDSTEAFFIAQSILSQTIPRKDIFVLARTNRQIEFLSNVLDQHGIHYLKRTVEEKKENLDPASDQVTLSTVHAIKGLEAEVVYMVSVTSQNYPCLTQDHPVLSLAKFDDHYDKFDEEIRLLYVGLTRAKKQLIISHYNTLSRFIDNNVQKLITIIGSLPGTDKTRSKRLSQFQSSSSNPSPTKRNLALKETSIPSRLRQWRMEIARQQNLRPYMIFSDKTLEELAAQKPTTLEDLEGIYGLGPHKIRRFGRAILDIISGL